MINTLILCFGCFVCGGFVGMMTLLFMQGAFYNCYESEEKGNQSSINRQRL